MRLDASCSGDIPTPRSHRWRRLRPTSASRILDVGCGTGYFVCQLFDAGIAGVMGVDPFIEKPIAYRNGPRILKAALTDITGEWDIIMFHHSLEHVPDPLETLEACAVRLAPSGTCVVRVPTVSSYAWRHYQQNWYAARPAAPCDAVFSCWSRAARKASGPGTGVCRGRLNCEPVLGERAVREQRRVHVLAIVLIAPHKSPFTAADIRTFDARARDLNARGEGDQAVFYLKARGV